MMAYFQRWNVANSSSAKVLVASVTFIPPILTLMYIWNYLKAKPAIECPLRYHVSHLYKQSSVLGSDPPTVYSWNFFLFKIHIGGSALIALQVSWGTKMQKSFIPVYIRYLLPLHPACLCFSCVLGLESLGVVLLVYFLCYAMPDLKWCFSHPISVFIYLFNENMYPVQQHSHMFNV